MRLKVIDITGETIEDKVNEQLELLGSKVIDVNLHTNNGKIIAVIKYQEDPVTRRSLYEHTGGKSNG